MATSGRAAELVSILQLPFVLTAEAKTQILHGEAMMRKQQEMESSVINVSAWVKLLQGRQQPCACVACPCAACESVVVQSVRAAASVRLKAVALTDSKPQ